MCVCIYSLVTNSATNLGITDVRYTYITTYLCTFRNSTLDVTEPVQTPPIDFVIQNETVSYRYICLRQV